MRRLYRGSGLAATVVAMGFGLVSCTGSTNAASPSALPVSATALAPSASRAAPAAVLTAARTQLFQSGGTIGMGNSGPVILILQQQLSSLGYWLGAPSSTFGSLTQQAVFALQKAAGLPRTGIVNDATLAALDQGVRPVARSTSGHVLEVNLTTDLLMVVDNGVVTQTFNTSTGGGYVYFSQGHRGVAITPRGHFTTYRQINGVDVAPLGTLYRPKFFTGGYAIHGDSYVPAHPVSHGCVRVSDAAINYIWASGVDPIGTSVWIY